MCVETVVGPFHHFSVEGWGRQQQQRCVSGIVPPNVIYRSMYITFFSSFSEDSKEYSVWSRDLEDFSSEIMSTVQSVLRMYCIQVDDDMHTVVHDGGE